MQVPHQKTPHVAFWNANLAHKEETVEKKVTRLDFRKQHYLSKSNHIINPPPESFYLGLLQTQPIDCGCEASILPSEIATSPPHTCCMIRVIMGSTAPP